LQEGYQELVDAQQRWQKYLGATIEGAERTVEALRTIRDGAIAVEVGLVTGGAGYSLLGGGSVAAGVSTVTGAVAATATAAAAPSKLGEATRGTLGDVAKTGVIGNIKLAAHGIAGMIMGLGHGLSQIPHGLVSVAKTIGELFTDPRQFTNDMIRFRDAIEQLWENREALWTAFEREAPEKQAFLVGEFFGQIESNLVAMEATRAIGRGLPKEVTGSIPQLRFAATAKGNLVPVITSRLVKLRLETIKKLIALGALDPALISAAGGKAAAIGSRPAATPLFSKTPSPPPPLKKTSDVQTAADVVSGGTTPLVEGKSPLGHYGIDKYGTFADRPKDKFPGHELLQNLWLGVKGFGRRLEGPASKENPAVALTHAEHVEVGRQQRAMGLLDWKKVAQMSAEQVIEQNALAMKRAGIPDFVIETLKKEALRHAATLKPLAGGGVP
jgi:hypothetical protein